MAVAYGALDIRALETAAKSGIDYMLLPIYPTEPIGLTSDVAEFWISMVHNPLTDDSLTPEQRKLVREFEDVGIASRDLAHPARITNIREPWFSSPIHELVCSMIASVARDLAIDLVFIKGPMLHQQGLREREHSGDVDIWSDPIRVLDLQDALTKWGWKASPEIWDGTPVNHSITLRPNNWGCEIDLHRHFPGSALPDRDAFSVIQQRRVNVQFASVDAYAPMPAANRVLMALHTLRPEIGSSVQPAQFTYTSALLQAGGEEAAVIAHELRATSALSDVLARSFPERVFPQNGALPANWAWRTRKSRTAAYLTALRTLPINQQLRVLGQLVWPSAEIIRESALRADSTKHPSNLAKARLERFARGCKVIIRSGN